MGGGRRLGQLAAACGQGRVGETGRKMGEVGRQEVGG